MDTRRLRFLLELSRLGSMRAVADVLAVTTSTVSQQIARLSEEMSVRLIEPQGRNVRLTPEGRRLARHATGILAAVDAAYQDLDPQSEPAGVVRVAGFVSAIRKDLMPVIAKLAVSHPRVHIVVSEHEPVDALKLLAAGDADLALTYDYNLDPTPPSPSLSRQLLWSAPWSLAVSSIDAPSTGQAQTSAAVFTSFRDHFWIGNSHNQADEKVIRTIASIAEFEPQMRHHVDTPELVEVTMGDLILANLGIGLLPANRLVRPGIELVPLMNPNVLLRAYTHTRQGGNRWPAVALLLARLQPLNTTTTT